MVPLEFAGEAPGGLRPFLNKNSNCMLSASRPYWANFRLLGDCLPRNFGQFFENYRMRPVSTVISYVQIFYQNRLVYIQFG
jgi:hypothetical protein